MKQDISRKAIGGNGARRARGCSCRQGDGLSRRRFMAAAGAFGAAAMLPGSAALAQSAPNLIDTHHHFYPPEYQKAWLDWEDARKIPHFPTQVAWTRAKTIEEMDRNGIKTAVLSIASTPGVWFDGGPEAASRMAGGCNEYGAEM